MRRGVNAALLGLAACGGSGASGTQPDGSTTSDATNVQTTGGDATSDAAGLVPADDGGDADDLPDPPPMACDGGGLANGCPSPPPACADARMAVVYGSGQCKAGMCSWSKVELDCKTVGGPCLAGAPQGVVVDRGIPGDAASDAGTWVGLYGCLLPVPSAPAPPAIACSVGAGADASQVCPPPPPQCAESNWLVSYDNSQCVAGTCAWETHYVTCEFTCDGGSCVSGIPRP